MNKTFDHNLLKATSMKLHPNNLHKIYIFSIQLIAELCFDQSPIPVYKIGKVAAVCALQI